MIDTMLIMPAGYFANEIELQVELEDNLGNLDLSFAQTDRGIGSPSNWRREPGVICPYWQNN